MDCRKALMLGLMLLVAATSYLMTCAYAADSSADQPLRIGLIPSDDMVEILEKFQPVQDYLESELGMQIETFRATDYSAVVEAMRSGKIDVAYFGPFSYILAAERANATAIIAGGDNATGKVGSYHSLIIVNKNSGITSIDDLKAGSKETTFAFVDPASTSGNLIPRGYLFSEGIDPDKDFKESIFAGGHDAVGLAVQSGKVDAGAIYDTGFDRMVESGALNPDEVMMIWTSEPIPKSPLAVRGNMDPELVEKIQQAFLDMPTKDPEALKSFESKWEKNTFYVPVDDSTYGYLREMAKAQGYI